jgi:hypothetical protein
MSFTSPAAEHHSLEARLAARMASALTPGLDTLGHDVIERLRFAREQALAGARAQRLAAPEGTRLLGRSSSGAAVLGGMVPWFQRAAGLLPLVVLVAGLFAIDNRTTREQVVAAAEIDSQLLADQLPPAAYSDPGFAEFLRSSPPP